MIIDNLIADYFDRPLKLVEIENNALIGTKMVRLLDGIHLLAVIEIFKPVVQEENVAVELGHTQLVALNHIWLIERGGLRIQLFETV